MFFQYITCNMSNTGMTCSQNLHSVVISRTFGQAMLKRKIHMLVVSKHSFNRDTISFLKICPALNMMVDLSKLITFYNPPSSLDHSSRHCCRRVALSKDDRILSPPTCIMRNLSKTASHDIVISLFVYQPRNCSLCFERASFFTFGYHNYFVWLSFQYIMLLIFHYYL